MYNNLDAYYAVRDEMKTGDLVQFNSSTMLGSTIRWRTRKDRRQYEVDNGIDVNHSAGIVRIPLFEGLGERRFLLESLEGGPSLHLLGHRLENFDGEAWWYPIVSTPEERIKWGERVLDCIGRCVPYGYGDIISFLSEQPDIDSKNGLFCAELWQYGWGDTGRAMSPNGLTNHRLLRDVYPRRIL